MKEQTKPDYRRICVVFSDLLEQIITDITSLSNGDKRAIIEFSVEDARELIGTGEEFVAFENLCSNLYEVQFPLTNGMFNLVAEVGGQWKVDSGYWERLRECVIK